MLHFYRSITSLASIASLCWVLSVSVNAQTKLTYPEINTALQTKLPNPSLPFKTKPELIKWIITQIKQRKVDKPLTRDREDDLRQAGATDEMIDAVRANSPPLAIANPTPTPLPAIAELGDLTNRATNLVKAEFTPVAMRSGASGSITVQVTVDELGGVTGVKPLNDLPFGLTAQAVNAARQSRFDPYVVNGKPTKYTGTVRYNFTSNQASALMAMADADEYRKKNDCDRATPLYSKAIEFDPNMSAALFGRGICHIVRASYDRAIGDLTAAAKLDEKNSDIYFYLAVATDFKGVSRTTPANYARAINLRPEISNRPIINCFYIDRGPVAKEQVIQFADQLIAACNASLRDPEVFLTSMIYMKRGIGYRLKHEYDQSIKDFDTAQQINPNFDAVKIQLHAAYNARGLMRYENKELKPALEDITKSIELNPQNPTPYINRCVIYLYGWKDADHAIEDCSTAIRLADKSSSAYNHRGYAYEMKKKIPLAIADYQMALTIDPANENAKANLERVQGPKMRKN